MAEKDSIFWDAIMEKNMNKKKVKKFKKYAKGIDAPRLADLFAITKKEVEDIFALFLRIDDDRSGAITAPEIAQGLSSFGCDASPKVVQVLSLDTGNTQHLLKHIFTAVNAVMRASDKNGDGEINFEEFLAVLVSKAKLKKHKELMDRVLSKLPEQDEEYLTVQNLQAAWSLAIGTQITIHEANALLAQVDTANDGSVTREHFKRMWQNA